MKIKDFTPYQEMREIVDATMESYQTDFTKHDTKFIEETISKGDEYLWAVTKSSTHMMWLLPAIKNNLQEKGKSYMINTLKGTGDMVSALTSSDYRNVRFFKITPDSMKELTEGDLNDLQRDISDYNGADIDWRVGTGV